MSAAVDGFGDLVGTADIPPPEQYVYSGDLGRARGPVGAVGPARTPPPEPRDILRTTHVARGDGTERELDRYYETLEERLTAAELRRRYDMLLRSIERRAHTKTPDALSMGGQWTADLKSSGGYRSVRTHLVGGMLQSERIIIDGSRRALTRADAGRALAASLHDYGHHYQEILILLPHDRALHWLRGD